MFINLYVYFLIKLFPKTKKGKLLRMKPVSPLASFISTTLKVRAYALKP